MAAFDAPCRILVVDADDGERSQNASYLSRFGFSMIEADCAEAMRKVLSQAEISLVILEPALPDCDGLTVLRAACLERRESGVPCIVVTANPEPVDRIIGLELGADDYLIKPIDRRELLAHVRAVLRRLDGEHLHPRNGSHTLNGIKLSGQVDLSSSNGLKFDRVRRRLSRADGTEIQLTTAEFNLLSAFTDHINTPLEREQLYQLVYHRSWNVYERTLDTLVAKLRRKVEEDPQRPERIKTVHGVGYVYIGDSN